MYISACVRLFEEGRCSRASILRFLREWRRESLLVGADVTLGVAKVLQERAGIAPIPRRMCTFLFTLWPCRQGAPVLARKSRDCLGRQGFPT